MSPYRSLVLGVAWLETTPPTNQITGKLPVSVGSVKQHHALVSSVFPICSSLFFCEQVLHRSAMYDLIIWTMRFYIDTECHTRVCQSEMFEFNCFEHICTLLKAKYENIEVIGKLLVRCQSVNHMYLYVDCMEHKS